IEANWPGPLLPVDFIQKAIVPVDVLRSGSAATVICVIPRSNRMSPVRPESSATQVAAWLVAELLDGLVSSTTLFCGAAANSTRCTSEGSHTGVPAKVA